MAWLTVMSMLKGAMSVAYVGLALAFAAIVAWVTPLGSIPARTSVVPFLRVASRIEPAADEDHQRQQAA
jgi:hypothetical protein